MSTMDESESARTNHDYTVVQKRKHSSSTGGGHSSPSSLTTARNGKNKQHRKTAAATTDSQVQQLSQHADKQLSGSAAPLSVETAKAYKANAALSVKGANGKMYSNYWYRMYAKRDCMANDNCFGCFQPFNHKPMASVLIQR